MKLLTILIATMVFFVSPMSVAAADITSPTIKLENSEWSQFTADDHLTVAQTLEQKVARLEAKILNMTEKITEYGRKPYLDTKGFRRDSLKRIIGSTLKEIKDLRERIAWHRTEASRLAEVPENDSNESNDEQNAKEVGNSSSS